jgi:hypothetical protein
MEWSLDLEDGKCIWDTIVISRSLIFLQASDISIIVLITGCKSLIDYPLKFGVVAIQADFTRRLRRDCIVWH